MNQQQYLLGVGLQALGKQSAELNLIPTILIFIDESGNYHFATGIEEIKTVILGMIPHLDRPYAHARTFNLQIRSGTRLDAYLTSLNYK